MTKFQAGTILTSHVMDCKVHAIGKVTRPLFADPVTYEVCIYGIWLSILATNPKQKLYRIPMPKGSILATTNSLMICHF